MIIIKKTKIIKRIIYCFAIFIGFTLIHEFSHILTAILSNNVIKEININWEIFLTVIGYGNVGIIVEIRNPLAIPLISISGSLGSIIACSIVIIYAYKKLNAGLLIVSLLKILSELLAWINSPILKSGDAFVLYEYIGLTNYFLPSVILLGICGFVIFSFHKMYGYIYLHT